MAEPRGFAEAKPSWLQRPGRKDQQAPGGGIFLFQRITLILRPARACRAIKPSKSAVLRPRQAIFRRGVGRQAVLACFVFVFRASTIRLPDLVGCAIPTAAPAGIVKPVTVITLRYSFASHRLLNEVDIRQIQELLGHQHVETTMIYTHVVKDLRAASRSRLDALERPAHAASLRCWLHLTI